MNEDVTRSFGETVSWNNRKCEGKITALKGGFVRVLRKDKYTHYHNYNEWLQLTELN